MSARICREVYVVGGEEISKSPTVKTHVYRCSVYKTTQHPKGVRFENGKKAESKM